MIEPPLPFGNAAARWYYVLLRGLVQRGHRVTALAACSREEDIEPALKIFPAPEYDLRCFLFPKRRGLRSKWESWRQPFSYVFSPELRRELKRELANGFDLLHLEMHWSGWLGRKHAGRSLLNVHYLYQIDWMNGRRLTKQERRLLRAERRLLHQYPAIRTLTPRLTKAVAQGHGAATVETVPLGLDVTLYEFEPAGQETETPTVGLVGSFNWGPSHSAAVRLLTRLWPHIKRRVPNARLLIVGREARRALLDLAATPDIEIYEDVANIIPYMRRMNVMLYAPGRGSGMKVKVLEAMALGLPVVTTIDGVEGLSAADGVHVGIADDDPGLIERTVSLLNEPERAARQSLAARLLVEHECDPDETMDGIERMYEGIAKR